MAAPKSIQKKAERLAKALATVDQLASELEEWYATKTDEEAAMDFFYSASLDRPYEFNLEDTKRMLDDAADGIA